MYDLVCDVARYREFLPGCISSELMASGEAEVIGRMAFTRHGRDAAPDTSRNQLTPPSRIDITACRGAV
jgi:ribosome-associated toxin RatA of RatAB toxin-antitoxin module